MVSTSCDGTRGTLPASPSFFCSRQCET
jgi:hypothetical protein